MTRETEARVIEMFWDHLKGWDWDSWSGTSVSDREEIAVDVIAELGIVDVDEVYDLFYDWSAGITEESFN